MKELQSSFDGRVSKVNSTVATLAGGAVFTGTAENIVDTWTIVVSVRTDVNSATDWLSVQFSPDWTNRDVTDVYTVHWTHGETYTFQPVFKWFRIVYTNGASPQTYFRLQTQFKTTYVKPSSHRIKDTIEGDDDAELMKSVLTWEDPNWVFRDIKTNINWNLSVSLEEQKDAFWRIRVSEPYTLFDNSLTSQFSDTLFWSTLTNWTWSWLYDNPTSKYTLSTATAGDYVVRQTKQRFKYQPWKSHMVLMTWLFNTEAWQIKRAGLLDYDNVWLATINNTPRNGVCFVNNAGTLSFCIYNNWVVTETVAQSSWNVDKLDGTGKSWITINVAYANILFFDLEWLWVWAVRCGFVSPNGEVLVAHQFRHASTASFTDVYMRTANLPISYAITSTAWAWSLKQICSSVISEGWFNPKGMYRSIYKQTAQAVASGATETILWIRLKEDSFEFATDITDVSILATTSWNWHRLLLFNPTYTGASTFTDVTNSVLQKATDNLPVTAYWEVIASWFFSADVDASSSDLQNALRLWKSLASVRDEIWLCVYNNNGWNESYVWTIWVREYI